MNANESTSASRRPPIRRGFWGILGATVIIAGLAGAAAQSALSEEAGWRARVHEAGFGHHGMMFRAAPTQAEVEDRVTRMVAHLAIELDATEEQKERLTAIFVGAAGDLFSLHEQLGHRREAAEELIGLLTGPTVDRAAVEQFRAGKLAVADEASRRIATALVDAAEVLTPEQRQKIGDFASVLVRFGPPFHRG